MASCSLDAGLGKLRRASPRKIDHTLVNKSREGELLAPTEWNEWFKSSESASTARPALKGS